MIRLGAARKLSWSRGRMRDVNACLIRLFRRRWPEQDLHSST